MKLGRSGRDNAQPGAGFGARLGALPGRFKAVVLVSFVGIALLMVIGVYLLDGGTGADTTAVVSPASAVEGSPSQATTGVTNAERRQEVNYDRRQAGRAADHGQTFLAGLDAGAHTRKTPPPAASVSHAPAQSTINVPSPQQPGASQAQAQAMQREISAKLQIMTAINTAEATGTALKVVTLHVASSAPTNGTSSAGRHKSSATNKSGAAGKTAPKTATSQASAPQDRLAPGDVLFATLDTAIDSDDPGPVLVTIVGGPMSGAHMTGSFSRGTNAVTVKLNMLSWHRHSTSVNAVALDASKFRTWLATDVDHHYIERWGGLLLSGAASGGLSLVNRGTIGAPAGGSGYSTLIQPTQPTGREIALAAIGGAGQQFVSIAQKMFSIPNTIYVAQGTEVGVMFLSPVSTSWVPPYHQHTKLADHTP